VNDHLVENDPKRKPTLMNVKLTASDFIVPEEDRAMWNIIEFNLEGIYGIPQEVVPASLRGK